MNVSLTPELDRFVASKVESGEYATASEVVRGALRALKEDDEARQLKLEALRAEIEKGRQGPFRDGAEFFKELKEKFH